MSYTGSFTFEFFDLVSIIYLFTSTSEIYKCEYSQAKVCTEIVKGYFQLFNWNFNSIFYDKQSGRTKH